MRSTELVYVADPDPTFRGNLATVLRASGIEVVEFASGAALEAGALAGGPDLVVTASGSPAMEGRQVLARVKCRMSGRRYPLVLVTDRNQSLELVANSVRSLLADWNRLSLHNLASVVTWLQTRGRSGRFEVEAFGVPGTIVLREGEIAQARWKELRGRDVLVYFAQEFPDAGFRFSESLAGELALPSSSGSSRWEIAAPARDLAGRPREIA
ncbi:MAG: hypothetical protein ABR599_09165, partial [Gemmatimonadota bacterium]